MANKVSCDSQAASPDLGQSAEDYLEAVYLAAQEDRHVRVTDIADRLRVSKPAVVSALAGLKEKGLVRHRRYRGVELTDQGAAVARTVYRRHRLVLEFLRDVLGVDEQAAAEDACQIEHVVGQETIERLVRMVEFVREHDDEDRISLSQLRGWLDRGGAE